MYRTKKRVISIGNPVSRENIMNRKDIQQVLDSNQCTDKIIILFILMSQMQKSPRGY